ncbi:uncharacterized protein LOC144453991 isoform X2 [Glandiceps talaboti]
MSTPAGGQLSDKLRLAASKGQTAKIKELVESGATFDPDKNGRTAVHYAALNGHATTIKACIQQGCEPDTQDVAGRSPLHLAVTDGHVEAIKALIEEGCPVDRQDQVNGNTALHESAWNGYSKSVEVLVNFGRANLHVANRNGMRPLHMSIQNGHNESTRVLLRNGAHPDARNNIGESPLHVASTHGHVTCCRILISANCDINAVNRDGNTPLHIAASLGKRKITKILVDAGCDIGLKNNKGQTAIDVARDHEYPEVIIIMTNSPRGQSRSRRHHHHRNQMEYHQGPAVMGRREQRATGQGMMGVQTMSPGHYPDHLHHHHHDIQPMSYDDMEVPRHRPSHRLSPRQSQSQKRHGVNITDAPRSGFGPPWQQQTGMTWQQQVWNQWSWQRQQEQHYQNLQGQRQAPLERVIDDERNHQQDIHLGRAMGNPHEHSEYYRDPMGNVRERQVSNCNCMPYIRRLENQLEATKEKFMYEIESTSQMMEDKMKYFDKKMAHQSSCLDQLCKERITAERTECLHRIDRRAQKEQAEFERRSTVRINALRRELKGWFEDRFKHFERKYGDDFVINGDGSIIDRTSDPGQDDDDEYDEPGASLLRSKSEGRLPSNYHNSEHTQNCTESDSQEDEVPSTSQPGGNKASDQSTPQSGVKPSDPITATRTLQEVRYAKTKPIENAAADPLLLEEESENTATDREHDSNDGRPVKPPKPPKPPKPAKPPPPPRTVSYPSNPTTGAIPKRTVGQQWEQQTRNVNGNNVAGHTSSPLQSSQYLTQNHTSTNITRPGQNVANTSEPGQNNSNYLQRNSGNDTTNLQGNSRTDISSSHENQPTPNRSFLHRNSGVKSEGFIRPNPTQSGGMARFYLHSQRTPAPSYSALRTQNSSQSPHSIAVSPISVNTSLANASIPAKESPSTLTSSPDSTSTPRAHNNYIAMNNNRDSSDSTSTSTSSRSRRDPIDPLLALALLEENNNPAKIPSSKPPQLIDAPSSSGQNTPSPVPYGQQTRRSMYSPLDRRNQPISKVDVRQSQQVARDNSYKFTASGKPHPSTNDRLNVESPGEQVVPKSPVPPRQNGGPHCKSNSQRYSTDSSDTSFDAVTVTQHFFDTVSTQMERWYERRIQDVQKQAENKVVTQQNEMKTKLEELESQIKDLKTSDEKDQEKEGQILV